MGMLACFHAVDFDMADRLKDVEDDDIIDAIEEFEDNEEIISYSMEKLWDGLHFLLTGTSASAPIKGNHLSEAIVGVSPLEIDTFVAITKTDDLDNIINALDNIKLDSLRNNFNIKDFQQANIYPNIWVENEKDTLFEELKGELEGLIAFYKKSQKAKKTVVISIY